tara:strand:+ start:4283 stop:6205 length:1923 start_codon:yes stop_codon:yes gene_type:complete
MKLYLLLLLLLIPAVNAQVSNYNQHQSLELKYTLSADILITETGSNPKVDYINSELKLTPLESNRQRVQSQEESSSPKAEITKDGDITYTWRTLQDKYTYTSEATISTENVIYQVPHIQFPIEEDLPTEVIIYTQAAENIEITDSIREQANEIVEGEIDLYTAVYLLADWTKTNIEYDLNTLTAKAALPSSWVLENREGVCDEMTSLFISMARSVGIPARFVSGSVYTNLDYTFGNHGWAEVYFPGEGWVPYDPTFGHYGWVDPSHIALSKTKDSAEPAVTFTWRASDISIDSSELAPRIAILSQGSKLEPIYELKIEPLENNVAPGSYVPFKVTTKTPYSKFTSNTLTITTAPGLTEDNSKSVLLEPNSEKSTYWIAEIDENTAPGFTYTTTLTAIDLFGSEAEATVNYAEGNKRITKEEAEATINLLLKQESKTYSEDISLDCDPSKDYYYNDETGEIICNLKNTGNKALENIEICFKECEKVSLGIAEEKVVKFTVIPDNLPEERKVIAKVNDIELIKPISFNVFEEANLRITNVDIPETANYKDKIDIILMLDSPTEVENINIKINNREALTLKNLKGPESATISVPASHVLKGVSIEVNYDDGRGNSYSTEQEANIEITNVPFYAKILSFFTNLF